MILRAFLLALGQIGDGRFLRVLALGAGLSLLLLVGLSALSGYLAASYFPDTITLPGAGEIGGGGIAVGIGVFAVVLGLSVFLMMPVAALFCGFFTDRVADAVEDRHYPGLPPTPGQSFGDSLVGSVNFFGVLVAVNAVALLLYVLVGPFAPILFWAVNGYLLGREYFEMAAARHLGRSGAKALRKSAPGTVFLAGCLMAAPLSVPFVNLLIPVFGAATFTHLFHMMTGRAPVRGH
ncbi:MAG: hypothetical protein RLZZ528_439 [Pseudomonadota bacterium]